MFTKLPTPTVRGTYAAEKTLTATTALPSPAPAAITWQWLRDERPIVGATGSSYRLTLNDRDKFVRVVATYKKPNYLNAVRSSGIRWVPGPLSG